MLHNNIPKGIRMILVANDKLYNVYISELISCICSIEYKQTLVKSISLGDIVYLNTSI